MVALTSGTSIGRYRIISPLGAGGMGEVYLAEDTRLGRRVALKILPANFTGDEDRLRRFEQEARAASALNHPNIITIHEVGTDNGTRFIAAEFVEGETLRARLKRGRMSVSEALDVAVQVAGALAAAHQAGIVHRDIKPENIMLRPDGYVKVLDFGIVKLTEEFTEQHFDSEAMDVTTVALVNTESNIVMGSPNYMSPEQARGLAVDARTDIFSLGVILYEMMTGKKPFVGQTISDVIVSILERQPAPLSEQRDDLPPNVERIVFRAMAKDREARYKSVGDLLRDLKRQKQRLDYEAGLLDTSLPPDFTTGETVPIDSKQATRQTVKEVTFESGEMATLRATSSAEYIITEIKHHKRGALVTLLIMALAVAAIIYLTRSAAPAGIDSIAVLPFANLGADPNTEYLSDGITESLINNLSQSRKLKVMSRNSVFHYKGQVVDAKKVGRDLGVSAVLMGRITERGDSLSINIDLVDARDNSQIWGEQFNRKLSDIISLQEEIARQISDKLRLRLTSEDERRVNKRYTENSEAYQLYLKGRFYWNKRTEEGLKRGIDYFNQAIEQDPVYALAYAGLADCYALLAEYSVQPPRELYAKARAAAERAIDLDDTLAEAHTSLAAVNEYDWNWPEAERQYERAIQINPNYATARHWYGVYLSNRLRLDEALREMRKAEELDPLSTIISTALGRVLYYQKQYDRAIEVFQKAIEMDPNFAEAHFQLGLVYEQKRMYDDALREIQKSVDLFGDRTMVAWVGRVYAVAGRRAEAERVLAELKEMSKTERIWPYPMATIYAALGEKERAFEWLNRLYEDHSYYVIWLNADPVFEPLRADPRFQDLLRRVGY